VIVYVVFLSRRPILEAHKSESTEEIKHQHHPIIIHGSKYGSQILLQLPENISHVQGIMFVAHACTHSAYDFWPPSPHCAACIGLAEEVAIVQASVSKEFAVIAMSSLDRQSGCWGDGDIAGVVSAVQAVQKEYALEHIPVFALGCSSGGRFVWKLAQISNLFNGIVVQSMSLDIMRASSRAQLRQVPVVFNPMSRDSHTLRQVRSNMDMLVSSGYHIGDIVFQECQPLPVTSSYLVKRLWFLHITFQEADLVISALEEAGHLSRDTGMLLKDPTNTNNNWRAVLIEHLPVDLMSRLVLTRGKSPLAKVLHRAWAFHEYCADYVVDSIEFLMSKVTGRS